FNKLLNSLIMLSYFCQVLILYLRPRAKIYAEVSEILHGEAVRLPIVHSQPLLGKRKNIQGWIPSPLGSESFEDVSKS
ncbi:hypothetical protein, partial [Microcoleus sp. Pol10D4]|uniref:hypothetical protein n=1 Tax=Microcoleus sp. Pol10D4 TaxID=3055387 RepID=UPI002FCE6D80